MLATPVMINVIEAAALNAIEHLLPAGHQNVAATPVGLQVTATAAVLRVEGRTITFRVEARDGVEMIAAASISLSCIEGPNFSSHRVQHANKDQRHPPECRHG